MSCSRTTRPGAGGLPYHEASYWQNRFTTDPREASGFEWLSSSTSLISLLPQSLLLRSSPTRILHIGVGTSRLSLELIRYYRQNASENWKERAKQVVNVDFSEKSIGFQRHAEAVWLKQVGEDAGEETLMVYHVLDLLDYAEVDRELGGKGRKFDVVLDKSTSDSISTGEDIPLESIHKGKHHSSLMELTQGRKERRVATTQILGVNLASIVEKGGVWLCHSYSSDRWEDVIPGSNHVTEEEVWPWTETSKIPVPVKSSDPNAPQINHWIYTLHRT